MRTWVDENTGRTVRQLTSFPKGAKFAYFRVPRNLPDGRIVVYLKHEHGSMAAVDVESGDIQMIPHERGTLLRFRESDGRAWFYDKETREVLERGLLEGTSRVIGHLGPWGMEREDRRRGYDEITRPHSARPGRNHLGRAILPAGQCPSMGMGGGMFSAGLR